jgi:hypothetical protein
MDLLLRVLEQEALERTSASSSNEFDISDDIMITMAQAWVLQSYEVIRAANSQSWRRGETFEKLKTLKHRLGLVRIAIAKAEIQDQKASSPEVILDVVDGDRDPKPYMNDGSYIVPRGVCGVTGAVVWWPVDITRMTTVEISRRDLSDELLSLFD